MAFLQAGFYRLEGGRIQGNPVRYFLFRRDGKVLFEEHKKLFMYMKTFKGIKFITVNECVKILSDIDQNETSNIDHILLLLGKS